MDFKIRQIMPQDYGNIRMLDRVAFGCNERGSDADFHERFADRIRKSEYYIPELELVAVGESGLLIGHAIFTALPMGDNGEHVVWLDSLSVRHDEKDDHNTKSYQYQRKGIGTALVGHGMKLAAALGFTACMVCGNPSVYRQKMGFENYLNLGITKDETVEDPDWAIFAKELQPNGFQDTDKVLSFQMYGFMH